VQLKKRGGGGCGLGPCLFNIFTNITEYLGAYGTYCTGIDGLRVLELLLTDCLAKGIIHKLSVTKEIELVTQYCKNLVFEM
jgi:hypothetical protein